MKLSQLHKGQSARIVTLRGGSAFLHRLAEMGFVKGQQIEVTKNAPLRDPIEYKIMGYQVSLRRIEAAQIEVSMTDVQIDDSLTEALHINNEHGAFELDNSAAPHIKVALVGNPNSGKTSLFNALSGLSEHVGNYSGVTVDSKEATVKFEGYKITVVDLPGTYSIADFSPEERVVADFIRGESPDIIINVVDSTNLERNLYLTTQLIDMEVPFIMALNMWDEFQSSGNHLKVPMLSKLLGAPAVPTVAKRGRGMAALLDQIVKGFNNPITFERKWVNYPLEIENFIQTSTAASRYDALQQAESDEELEKLVSVSEQNSTAATIATARYAFINGALKESLTRSSAPAKNVSAKIDKYLTHKYLGLPMFIFFMWFTFYLTFTVGQYPMDWIEMGVGALRNFVAGFMSDGAFSSLVLGGIIDGVGGVIVFLPNILILFFCISLMEDTGYMARTAFITDKLMHKIGLHGKSFIPLVIGFGCTVPAIISTRTIENRGNRLQTMLIAPFMSCSARLPVYVLVVGAFFPNSGANAMFLIYFAGIFVAILTSLILKKLFFSKSGATFVMELPPYRVPTVRNTIKQMWSRGSQYLKKMGGIILIAAVIVWALGYFPMKDANSNEPHQSYIEQIGRAIEPAVAPLGFDWKMGVSLMSGVAAKEIVVSSMSVLYNEGKQDNEHKLTEILQKDPNWNTAVALSFITFVLLYFPCTASIVAIGRESGKWKWAAFTVIYTTGVAWLFSYIVYNVALAIISIL